MCAVGVVDTLLDLGKLNTHKFVGVVVAMKIRIFFTLKNVIVQQVESCPKCNQ